MGEGRSDTEKRMDDASAMSGMLFIAEHHSRVVLPATVHALVWLGGLQGTRTEAP